MLSLLNIYQSLGLPRPVPLKCFPDDVGEAAILAKVNQHRLAERLGAVRSVEPTRNASFAANMLDAWSETGREEYLLAADRYWMAALDSLTELERQSVWLEAKAACAYFYYEESMRQRLLRGDHFSFEELVEYQFRRGSDSLIYAALLAIDGITSPGLVVGLRTLQCLQDMQDDIVDLEADRRRIGTNMLLFSVKGSYRRLRKFAENLADIGKHDETIPALIRLAISENFERFMSAYHRWR